MRNNDPKAENQGLLSKLFWFIHDDNSQRLKASKEPDIDRSIRYNERNQKLSGGAIVALFTYLASRDFSNFNIEFLADIKLWCPDFKTTLQYYSQLISASWDSITALVAGIFTFALILFFASTVIRGECLKRKARLIEITDFNNEITQMRQEYEQVKDEAIQLRERAEKAESELAQLRDKTAQDAAKIVKLHDRIEKAEADAANYLNRAKKSEENELILLRQIVQGATKSEEAYDDLDNLVERIKAETDLIKTKEESIADKAISDSFNKGDGN